MSTWRYHTEAVRDVDHALEMLDDTNSLIYFCAANMPDVERYNRGGEAFWRVVHWIVSLSYSHRTMVVGDIELPHGHRLMVASDIEGTA